MIITADPCIFIKRQRYCYN